MIPLNRALITTLDSLASNEQQPTLSALPPEWGECIGSIWT